MNSKQELLRYVSKYINQKLGENRNFVCTPDTIWMAFNNFESGLGESKKTYIIFVEETNVKDTK
jgi:hypothetical protein